MRAAPLATTATPGWHLPVSSWPCALTASGRSRWAAFRSGYLAEEWFRPQLDSQAAAVVDLVLEYVFSNHAGSVKMSEAAALVGMPEPTFSKYFKRATGQNFSDLVRKLRLAHARRLLERTDKAISDICYEVGFSNLSNFNRHFLNDAGETPRNYRQRVQG